MLGAVQQGMEGASNQSGEDAHQGRDQVELAARLVMPSGAESRGPFALANPTFERLPVPVYRGWCPCPPKRTGTIAVQPIRVGAERTEPLSLRVNEAPEGASGSGGGELHIPPVGFEGSVRGSRGQRGGFSGSRLSDAFFERFFQDSPLSGDPFSMFDRSERVSARSRGITLDVKARPGGYVRDDWLPAEELEIADSWAESLPDLRVGEPVKRTLTLQVKGLSGPQIPEIEIPAVRGLRVYPETTTGEEEPPRRQESDADLPEMSRRAPVSSARLIQAPPMIR